MVSEPAGKRREVIVKFVERAVTPMEEDVV